MEVDIVFIRKIDRKMLDCWWLSMHIEFKDFPASFCWTNKVTIQMSLDFILHPTTNLYSCSIRTLVDVPAQILDSFQSSRDLNIEMTIKEKKKLRTIRDHILIGESGPIAFKNQAIVRPSIEWITVLSPICHKLHSAISPSILHQFSRSQWLRKALEKTFRSVPVTSRGDQ